MEIRCPSCRKVNIEISQCGRCEADLSMLIFITTESDKLIKRARKMIIEGEYEQALKLAKRSWSLKKAPQGGKLLYLLCLQDKKYKEAYYWYKVLVKK